MGWGVSGSGKATFPSRGAFSTHQETAGSRPSKRQSPGGTRRARSTASGTYSSFKRQSTGGTRRARCTASGSPGAAWVLSFEHWSALLRAPGAQALRLSRKGGRVGPLGPSCQAAGSETRRSEGGPFCLLATVSLGHCVFGPLCVLATVICGPLCLWPTLSCGHYVLGPRIRKSPENRAKTGCRSRRAIRRCVENRFGDFR